MSHVCCVIYLLLYTGAVVVVLFLCIVCSYKESVRVIFTACPHDIP